MQIVLRSPEHEWDLTVPNWRATTLRDLAAELGIVTTREDGSVDGHPTSLDTPLGETSLHIGSVVEFDPTDWEAERVVDLCVVAGPGSATRLPLRAGEYALGDSDAANIVVTDAGLARIELILRVSGSGEVHIRRAGTLTPVTIDGIPMAGPTSVGPDSLVQVGATGIRFRPYRPTQPAIAEQARRRGTVAFNRPPRTINTPTLPPLALPAQTQPPRRAQRFRWITALAPLVAGVVMALLLSPLMLIFALMSPVMIGANWFEDRSRVKRETRENSQQLAESLDVLERELAVVTHMDRKRLLAEQPDVAEAAWRALARSDRLWERRPHHRDFMQLLVGYGDLPWEPPPGSAPAMMAEEAKTLLSAFSQLAMCPIPVDLGAGRVVGITGARAAARRLATALLLQTAVHHGPADVRIAVLTEPDRHTNWEWAKWLPHTILDRSAEQRWLASTTEEVARLVRMLREKPESSGLGQPLEPETLTMLVVDLNTISGEQHAALRDVLAGMGKPVAGLVLGDQLPSSCTAVIELSDARSIISLPAENHDVEISLPVLVDTEVAGPAAAALARLEDPDLRQASADLPSNSRLADLLDLAEVTGSRILSRWRAQPPRSLAAPVGESASGPLVIDLVSDGPHGLVAGTTGSGKSELLRTMVASMAASVDPEGLNFVLVDYKGGSAFDACADLPHTVGLVTDLDAHLGERALVSLEAELRYREGRLREVGASDISEYQQTDTGTPLPRLVVIIDEFAALAKELPAFVASLVDIAQRGRSLGVHMLLATQRPSGVVSDNIKANTNLRIALRVQDAADSTDVIGDKRAAAIGRRLPGRAFLRLGPAETFPFQAALVTGTAAPDTAPRSLQPFAFAYEPPGEEAAVAAPDGPTDLEELVQAVREATAAAGIAAPRRPWLEPLAAELPAGAVPVVAGQEAVGVTIGLLDDPYRQAQQPFSWRADRGNLLIFGAAGAGTSTALLGIATRLATAYSSDEVHLYGIDYDGQGLLELRSLPHTGAMVAADDIERQQRLIRMLRTTIDERRRLVAERGSLRDLPAILFLLDEYAGLRAAFDEGSDHRYLDALNRVMTDGPGLGVYTIATAKRATGFPSAIVSVVAEKLIMKLADPSEASGFGLYGSALPNFVPGRAISLTTGHEVQLDRPVPVDDMSGRAGIQPPVPIESLATQVKLSEVIDDANLLDQMWHLPLGIGDTNLEVVGWELGEGDHGLIAGAGRSGRSTALVSVAATVARHRPDLRIIAFTPRPSPLGDLPTVEIHTGEPGEVLADLPVDEQLLVLIDDAEFVSDTAGDLQRFLADRPQHIRVIAAGRADALRTAYGHWTQEIRRSRFGLILDPSPLTDGDLFGVQLPRTQAGRLPTGRGYVVANGEIELIQAAQP